MNTKNMNLRKEVAKFCAGIAANQIMTHGAFALNDISFTLMGISYTRQFNTIAVIFWLAAFIFLVYYAWFKKKADAFKV